MNNPNGSVTKAEFSQFEKAMIYRLERMEKKMDKLNDRVLFIYGWAGGVGMIAGVVGSILF